MLEPNTVVGQYKIIKMLASTPSSEVYLVECTSLKTELVLKVSCTDDSAHNDDEHFQHQARIMHEFSYHPNIVSVMHVAQYHSDRSSYWYMVMPYYPQTLADVLSLLPAGMSAFQSLQYIMPVFDAVAALHQKGVLHLDIKPQNIFVDKQSNVALGDFDNAWIMASGMFASSPLFAQQRLFFKASDGYSSRQLSLLARGNISPAKADSTNIDIGPADDLYSLGVLWFRLLSGQVYKGDSGTLTAVLEKVAPTWLQTLILKLLQISGTLDITSVQVCIDYIQQHHQTSEDIATESFHIEDGFSTISTELSARISDMLSKYGEVDETGLDELTTLYVTQWRVEQGNSQSTVSLPHKTEIHDDIHRLIETTKQRLSDDKNLSAWFAWINYLNVLGNKKLNAIEYQQVLQTGKSSRPDAPELAQAALLRKCPHAQDAQKRYVKKWIPIALIVVVLLYWWVPQQTLYTNEENVDTLQQSNTANNVFDRHNQQSSAPTVDLLSEPNAEAQLPVKGEATHVPKVVLTWLETLQQGQVLELNIHNNDLSNSATLSLVKLPSVSSWAVMQHEVTNKVYALCIQDNACRTTKRYTVGAKLSAQESPLKPKVNVSWHAVNEDFIPWITNKTGLPFSLPTYAQWQVLAKRVELNSLTDLHCKDCRHSVAHLYANGTMPIDQLSPDLAGLTGVYGNAQEWLQDCYSYNGLQRCEQALVAGGSWISTKRTLYTQPIDHLLKVAKTPTTGFRLVLNIEE